jgi:uncharacterized protein YyaL (SSP411 family)
MTLVKKPVFAGTFTLRKQSKYGRIGFIDLLTQLHNKWDTDVIELFDLVVTEDIKQNRGTKIAKVEVTSETFMLAYKQRVH